MKLHRDISALSSCAGAGAICVFGLMACSSTPAPAPPTTPAVEPEEIDDPDPGEAEPEEVETNMDCVKGMALCEGGICKVDVTNSCEGAVTCELKIGAVCQGDTTAGEAVGKGRDTIPQGKTSTIEAGANCEGSAAVATQVKSLQCR
jgi:hypothetical protein